MPVRDADGWCGALRRRVSVSEWVGLLLNVVQVTFTPNVHREIIMKAQKGKEVRPVKVLFQSLS